MAKEELTKEERRQIDLERLKIYYELLNASVWERYKLLPQVSVLATALLIIATFNEKIIQLTKGVHFLLIVFLLLIPISLISYLIVLYQAEKHARNNIEKISQGLPTEQMEPNFFTAYLPWYIVGIISIAIIFLAFLVW